ncbi:MAG: choline kinase family protein [Woeseiaceae bacterium]
MSDAVMPESVIRALPDWRDATWSELPGGLSNRTWLLQKDGAKAVLKIDGEPRATPFGTREQEAAVQRAAESAGLAGAVLFVNERVYLTEFVAGSQWQPSLLDQPARIEQLAASLRRLHGLPRSGRSFDALGAGRRYADAIADKDDEVVSHCLRIIRGNRLPNYLCCCHNDLVAENILTTPAIKFLDWEYACDNDPVFDLATVVEHHELGDGIASALLDAYFDGGGERWLPRLAEQRRLYLALHYLWMAARADSSAKSLEKLGARLITSCS